MYIYIYVYIYIYIFICLYNRGEGYCFCLEVKDCFEKIVETLTLTCIERHILSNLKQNQKREFL